MTLRCLGLKHGLVKPALTFLDEPLQPQLMRRSEMASYSLVQAAEVAGVSKATFWRLVKRGVVSASRAEDGSYRIEASEFQRYLSSVAAEAPHHTRLKQAETGNGPVSEPPQGPVQVASLELEIAKLKCLLELERERVELERQRVVDERRRADELRQERDRWASALEATQRQLVDFSKRPRGLFGFLKRA
jgi:excisionase family DNA binding protein